MFNRILNQTVNTSTQQYWQHTCAIFTTQLTARDAMDIKKKVDGFGFGGRKVREETIWDCPNQPLPKGTRDWHEQASD